MDAGSLSIATTHTQARYVLPPVLKQFRDKYPKVRVHLHQGNSEQIADLAAPPSGVPERKAAQTELVRLCSQLLVNVGFHRTTKEYPR